MYAVRFDKQERRRHKLRNAAQSILLVGSLTLLAATVSWLLVGPAGILWVIIFLGMALAFSPTVSPQVILRLYRARCLVGHPVAGQDVQHAACFRSTDDVVAEEDDAGRLEITSGSSGGAIGGGQRILGVG